MRQSKAHEDAVTVREAAGEAIGITANGVTLDMTATGSDRDATVKDAKGDGSTVKTQMETRRQSERRREKQLAYPRTESHSTWPQQ